MHDVELSKGIEAETLKKSIVLKNTKKTLNRNRDFKCITPNFGKGKRFGLRSAQDKDG